MPPKVGTGMYGVMAVVRRLVYLILVVAIAVTSISPSVHAVDGQRELTDQEYIQHGVTTYGNEKFECAESGSSTNVHTDAEGEKNLITIYNYMLKKGLTKEQAAGVVGNISIESGGYPDRLQGKSPSNGSNNPDDAGGSGWGLIQWTPGTKVKGLQKQSGVSGHIYELGTQLDLVWWHMEKVTPTGKTEFNKRYKQVSDVTAATRLYMDDMEAPAAATNHFANRVAAAKIALKYEIDENIVVAQSSGGDSCASGAANAGDIVGIAEAELKKNVQEYDSNTMKYTDGNREAWCADFVSWVYKEAGTPFTDGASGGWRQASVLNLQAWFKSKHTYFKVGEQKPQPGDVAFYIGSQTADSGSSQHVNIVTKVEGDTMTVIGGNQSDKVTEYTQAIKLGQSSLVGFGRMK